MATRPVQRIMANARALVTLCLLLLAALAWLADVRAPPRITPADAARWEGQSVTVSGWVSDVSRDSAGGQRFRIRDGGAALDGQADASDLRDGDWVEADGRLARLSGRLVLLVEHAAATRGPDALTPAWAEVADDPAAWEGMPLRLAGTITAGRLDDGNGHRLELGDGPWPPDGSGPVEVEGTLRYDEQCLCHRLDATLHGLDAPPIASTPPGPGRTSG